MAYGLHGRPESGHSAPATAKFLQTGLSPKQTPARRITDLHIYLPERERREILAWAQSESRTASNLVIHIVRQALASRDAGTTTDRRHPTTAKVQRP